VRPVWVAQDNHGHSVMIFSHAFCQVQQGKKAAANRLRPSLETGVSAGFSTHRKRCEPPRGTRRPHPVRLLAKLYCQLLKMRFVRVAFTCDRSGLVGRGNRTRQNAGPDVVAVENVDRRPFARRSGKSGERLRSSRRYSPHEVPARQASNDFPNAIGSLPSMLRR
jgi:hypothetical protein